MTRDKLGRASRRFLSLQVTLYLLLLLVRGSEDADDAYRNGRSLVLEYFLPVNLPPGDALAGREKRDAEGSGEGSGADEDAAGGSPLARLLSEGGDDAPYGNWTSFEGSGEVEDAISSDASAEEEGRELSAVPISADVDNAATTTQADDAEEVVGSTPTETPPPPTTTAEGRLVSTEMVFDRSEDFEAAETTEGRTLETTAAEETTATTPVGAPAEDDEEAATTPGATEGLPPPESVPAPTTREPVVEEAFGETKVAHKALEAVPGNVLQKENLSLAADPLLIANTRLMDSEETVQPSSAEPKRLGAYIVIALILLSFSSLVGYITFRKRMNRKRREFESNQESNDTEKALLSLSDYKDNSEPEENHLKNNEKAPIVVKSNAQINRYEKNTNLSSPKNLNTIANEKNVEKDNVLKSTAETLTQVIIEDSPKEADEEKPAQGMEKLIVKTRIDQDSIPKKPVLVNRCSAGYVPVPQDGS